MRKRNVKNKQRIILLSENGIKFIVDSKTDSRNLSLINGIELENI